LEPARHDLARAQLKIDHRDVQKARYRAHVIAARGCNGVSKERE
jgi:hypothetical protein